MIQGQAPVSGDMTIGKFTLQYEIEGRGIPTIVIGSSKYYPRVFSQYLRDHLKLVFLDHRGFVASPGPVPISSFSLDTIIHDVELVRAKLGFDKMIVVGHSGHSYMALEYAKKYPEYVSHVLMIGIAPDLGAHNSKLTDQHWNDSVDPDRKRALAKNFKDLPDEELNKLPPEEVFIKSYVRNGPRIWYDADFDSSPLWEGIEVNLDMFGHVWGDLFAKIDISDGLDDLELPIFLALGRYDNIVAPPSSWDSVRGLFKDLTIRVFEQSGHTPQYEEPILFDRELIHWIKKR